ncbi:MAG TPA: DUF3352 domain-containing protein [Candidatus Limnocylindrales bacterium]
MTEPIEPASNLEPTTEAVPTVAVEVVPPLNGPIAKPARRPLRWAVAAVATVVILAGSVLGVAVLSSAKSSSAVLPWAPADAVAYAEIRADMPGDQRANLLAFLSKFPGFADQTSFDAKADDGLDRLVKRLTDNKHDFSTEIKPWFGGQIGLSVDGTDATAPGVLLVASVSDTAKAAAWLTSIAPSGASHETVGGVDLTEKAGSSAKTTGAWGLDGSVLIAGTVDAVKAAISRGPSNALADSAGFKAAAAALNGDDLGSAFINVKSYVKLMSDAESQVLGQLGTDAGAMTMAMPKMPAIDTSKLPDWVAVRLTAESDHLVIDSAFPAVAGQPAQASRTSTLATELPASTIAQYELHDVGSLLKRTVTQLEGQPGGPTAAQVDAALKYVGGIDKAVGWLGDADVVVLHDGDGFSGGIVAQTTDASASTDLFAELKNLASLAGSQAGITVSTEPYDGQTITIVGAPYNGGATAGTVKLAFTQTNDLVIAGVGDGFVKAVLDTKAGNSLADQPAYQRAIGMAGSSNAGQGFVDLTSLRTALESTAAGAAGLKAYDSDVQPFLEPIQSIAWSQTVGSDVSSARFVLVLK